MTREERLVAPPIVWPMTARALGAPHLDQGETFKNQIVGQHRIELVRTSLFVVAK